MIIAGVLIFSIAVVMVSYRMSKNENPYKGKPALYVTLDAWVFLVTGLSLDVMGIFFGSPCTSRSIRMSANAIA